MMGHYGTRQVAEAEVVGCRHLRWTTNNARFQPHRGTRHDYFQGPARAVENFWSLLKRGINGKYVSVEPFHLFRCLDEQAFRYNNRKDVKDADRFDLAVRQMVGKRLTWDRLTGNENSVEA